MSNSDHDFDDMIAALQALFELEETPLVDSESIHEAATARHRADSEAWDDLQLEAVNPAINDISFPSIARDGFYKAAKPIDWLSAVEPFSPFASDQEKISLYVGLAEALLLETNKSHSEYQKQRMAKFDPEHSGYDKKIKRTSDLLTQVNNAVNNILSRLYYYLAIHFGIELPELQLCPLDQDSHAGEEGDQIETHLERLLTTRPHDFSTKRTAIARSHPLFHELLRTPALSRTCSPLSTDRSIIDQGHESASGGAQQFTKTYSIGGLTMKTIGFYSYKGGTGKSLCAANFAVCLSRLGYTSVIVDADVLGPSVHHKFQDGGSVAPGKGGLLNLIAASFDKDAWMRRTTDGVKPRDPVNVQNYIYQLDSPRDPVREGFSSKDFEREFGTIHILPAGDVNQTEYWNTVRSPLWHELFTLFDRHAAGHVSKEAYDVFLHYLLKIKSALGKIEVKPGSNEYSEPDYMIVDFGSGAGEMSTTLVNAWVDTLVYMLPLNDENINYLKGTFGKMADAGEARHRMGISDARFYIEVVLARVPASIQFLGDSRLERALRARHFDIDKMLVLHSDRDLEMGEEIRCGYQTLPQNRRLTHDYLKLFGALMEDDDLPGDGPDDLPDALGLLKHFEETERMFIHQTQYGTLINPNDGSRNVSFKVATFQNLLQGFTRGVSDALAESAGHSNGRVKSTDTLRAAGRRCGEEFGASLNQMMSGRRVGVQERVQKWTEFDSDVGFGRFWCDEDTIQIKGKRLIECDIYLLESFLTPAKDTALKTTGDHRFCSLMTGYIEGVLSRLFSTRIYVEHHHCEIHNLPGHIQLESGYRAEDSCEDIDILSHRSARREPESECCLFHVRTYASDSGNNDAPNAHELEESDTHHHDNFTLTSHVDVPR